MPTARFRRLIAQHKDLYITHHASSRTLRSLKGRTALERHERLVMTMRRAARRAWKLSTMIAAGICIASAVGTYAVLANVRPDAFAPALERFEVAWDDSNVEAIGALFHPDVREVESRRLAGMVAGHGWGSALPRPTGRAIQEQDANAAVDYELGALDLETSWVRSDRVWWLESIELPIPPFEPTLARFVEAWRASDLDAVVSFFAEDARAEMLASIEASVRERGWTTFPEIVETDVDDSSRGDVTVTFKLSRSKMRTEWHFRIDGTWNLHGLRFPRR